MKDVLIRAARTFVQTFLGVYLAGQFNVVADFANVDLLSSAAAGGIVAVLAFIQNWLETTNVDYNRG